MQQLSIRSALFALTFLCAALSFAQENEPQKFGPDVIYLEVEFVDYKPGKNGEAYGIINDHFAPASEAAGTLQPITVHLQTGQWDSAVHWRLENGPADMEWRRSPRDVKWFAALVAQEGSEAAALAIIAQYEATIARTSNVIGHRHVEEED